MRATRGSRPSRRFLGRGRGRATGGGGDLRAADDGTADARPRRRCDRGHSSGRTTATSSEASRCAPCAAATWIGMNLAYRGAVGPASGWLGRAQRLLDSGPDDGAERGYLLIPVVFRHEAAGDFEAAAAVAAEAAAIGERVRRPRSLLAQPPRAGSHADRGRQRHRGPRAPRRGDGDGDRPRELSPFVVGIVYCGVILACQEVFEVGRAREWTRALTDWADAAARPGRLHRPLPRPPRRDPAAERLVVGRARRGAARRPALRRDEEPGRRCRALPRGRGPAAARRVRGRRGGVPRGEPARLGAAARARPAAAGAGERRGGARGRFGGRPPRLAEPLKRAALLPAYVEIALAAGEGAEARRRCASSRSSRAGTRARCCGAMAAYARGAVALAEGDAQRRTRRCCARRGRPGSSSTRRTRSRVLALSARSVLRARRRRRPRRWSSRPRATSSGGSEPPRARAARAASGARRAHGLSRRELEVLASRGRRQEQPRDRRRTGDQRAHGRAARAEHLRASSASRHAPRRPPSRSSTTSSEPRRGQK